MLLPGEEPPHRSCHSKRFIAKVMILCAVARRRLNQSTGKYFDGKLGIWLFVHWVPASRASRNRPTGTLELKPLSFDRDAYRNYPITKVTPVIRERMFDQKETTSYIQQDNPRPYVTENNKDVLEEGKKESWDIS